MKIYSVIIALAASLVTAPGLCAEGLLSSDLEQYTATVRSAMATEPDAAIKRYLDICLAGADALSGLEADSPGVDAAFSNVVTNRLSALTDLPSSPAGPPPSVQAETSAYIRHLAPYRWANYIPLVTLQDQLLQRKYFKTETAKNSNFLEAYINGRWSLTRAIATEQDIKPIFDQHPTLGVSPWEAIFRFEPALAMRDGANAAILGTAGLSYTHFPRIVREPKPVTFDETPASRWLRKSGARLGAGAGRVDGKTRFLVGPGAQVSAVALWALYEPKGKIWMLGISATELDKLKKLFGWF